MRNYLEIALQYCDDVKTGVRIAGKLEKLAVQRFLNDLSRSAFDAGDNENIQALLKKLKVNGKKADIDFEYHLDLYRAEHACFFIETCPHVEGTRFTKLVNGVRPTIVMQPWQVFCTVNMFGWVDADGLRRFRYVYIEVAKKNGKSTWVAPIALYLAFIDGESGAQVYTAATSQKQAKIVFNAAHKMVYDTPKMRERFGIALSANAISQMTTNSFIKAVSKDNRGTQDGLNVHGVIIDELHAHKSDDMYNIMSDGIVSRDQPMVVAISTAGDDTTSKCYRERQIVVEILNKKAVHEQYFGMVFCLDRNDDWKDEAVWAKANPSLGVSVDLKKLQESFSKVKISPASESGFRQKHLNNWVGTVDGWIAPSVWENAKRDVQESEFLGQTCFGGYDLASRLDLAAWGRLRPKLEDGEVHWYFFSNQYINEKVIDTKEAINGEKRPDEYPVWRDEGYLIVTEGASTNFNQIEHDIERFHMENPFYEIGHDPYHASQLTSNLLDQGLNVVEVPQNTKYLSEPMRWIEQLLAEGRLHHNGDPVLAWCVLNVVVNPDVKENILPKRNKDRPGKKIDAAVGMIIAASRAMHYDNEKVFELVAGDDSASFDDYMSNFMSFSR